MSKLVRRLEDILEAITNIERHAVRGRNAFEHDELVQVWMLHHLRIIGEAVRVIKPEMERAYPEISWSGRLCTKSLQKV